MKDATFQDGTTTWNSEEVLLLVLQVTIGDKRIWKHTCQRCNNYVETCIDTLQRTLKNYGEQV